MRMASHADFGISKFCQQGDKVTEFCGTPATMAPEVFELDYGFPVSGWIMCSMRTRMSLQKLLVGHGFPGRAGLYLMLRWHTTYDVPKVLVLDHGFPVAVSYAKVKHGI